MSCTTKMYSDFWCKNRKFPIFEARIVEIHNTFSLSHFSMFTVWALIIFTNKMFYVFIFLLLLCILYYEHTEWQIFQTLTQLQTDIRTCFTSDCDLRCFMTLLSCGSWGWLKPLVCLGRKHTWGYLGLDFGAHARLVHHKVAVRHVNQRSKFRGRELNYWTPVVRQLRTLTAWAALRRSSQNVYSI